MDFLYCELETKMLEDQNCSLAVNKKGIVWFPTAGSLLCGILWKFKRFKEVFCIEF